MPWHLAFDDHSRARVLAAALAVLARYGRGASKCGVGRGMSSVVCETEPGVDSELRVE